MPLGGKENVAIHGQEKKHVVKSMELLTALGSSLC